MKNRKKSSPRGSCFLAFVLSLFFAGAFAGCSKGSQGQPAAKPAVPVSVATAIRKSVPVQLRAIGNVEAYSTVGVKPQVGGELTRVHFREGQDVRRGDLLFTVDPRPYEAALAQAEANLARDRAQLENARQEARRYDELVRKGYVSQSQYDQVRTNADALEAVVKADSAAVENARLQLSYCSIHSPVTGRTGSLIVHQGNVVKANPDNPIVVINQIQPIYVNFSIPEQHLNEIRRHMAEGKLKVGAGITRDEKRPEQGMLTFVDNAVDSATGTIRLKATFENAEKRLWPGQFVSAVLTLATQPDAVVVPSQAVQTGQAGEYVFVVKPDLTVESRPVVVNRTLNGETVIEKGVQPDETVVTDGQLRLVPGARVAIKKN